jgi:hypothetical protein
VFSPSENVLGFGKSPYNYIVLPAGKTEAARIFEENKILLKRLAMYKPYLKVKSYNSITDQRRTMLINIEV